MKFHHKTEPHMLLCLASENDQWRICVTPSCLGDMLVQVWCARDNPDGYCRVYHCRGAFFAMDVVAAVKRLLEKEDESIVQEEAERILPIRGGLYAGAVKGISEDREFFGQFMGQAGFSAVEIAIMWELAKANEPPDFRGLIVRAEGPAHGGLGDYAVVPLARGGGHVA